MPGAQPVAGDWNGNGVDTPGVLQNNQWFFDLEGNGYTGEAGHNNTLGAGTAVAGNGVYRPIVSPGIDFVVRTPHYSPGTPDHKTVQVDVELKTKGLVSGDVLVQLYWASGSTLASPNLQFAGQQLATARNERGVIGAEFTQGQFTKRPDTATHLIAVVNGDYRVAERVHSNNVKAVELPPRTFIFKIAGFAEGFGSTFSGLNLAGVTPSNHSPVIDVPTIVAPLGKTRGDDILANARSVIAATLLKNYATIKDHVVLIGHSYGGEVALRLASDVMPYQKGAQPAFALVLIDPIDYSLVEGIGRTNQSGITKSLPSSIKASSVMNISANPDKTVAFQGYQIKGAPTTPNQQRLWYGADNTKGTVDDAKHWTIDDDPRVHRAVNRFLDILVG